MDLPTVKSIMNDVLKSSHRQIVLAKKTEEEQQLAGNEALYKKLARSYRQAEEEFEKNSSRKSKGQRVMDKLLGRTSQNSGNDPTQVNVLAEDADLYTSENLIVFFNTGLVIKDDMPILRYSISQRDPKTTQGRFVPLQSILMSEVDEEKLGYEGNYRDTFVTQICAVVLYGARENCLEALKWKWPYVGKFDPDREVGVGTAKDTQKFFSKISGIDRDTDDGSRVL